MQTKQNLIFFTPRLQQRAVHRICARAANRMAPPDHVMKTVQTTDLTHHRSFYKLNKTAGPFIPYLTFT